MNSFETTATVEGQGHVLISGVPFTPGTEVDIKISPKGRPAVEGDALEEAALVAARERMRQLFQTTKGFRNSPRIPREDLYDR